VTIARIRDIDLYYEAHGSGEPLLLIPGLGSDANTWGAFVPQYSTKYRIILMENRGAGRSAKPEGPYATEQMAEDAVALLDHLGIERAHIIGKSMGGMIAQWIGARHPNRVRSLVLASTVMKHDSYGEELIELARLIAEKAGLFATYRQTFLMSYSRDYCMTNRTRLMQVEQMMKAMDEKEVLRGYIGQSIACQRHDSRAATIQIKAPTLVIVANEDMITTPQDSKDLANSIAGAELKIMPRGGHGFWREFPDDVNAVIHDFLSRH
jgi:pimeloyl-ACP methyl ester carboxylesterase